ncbi:hypothetical protein GCM10011309_27540 [Litorimonas cladophorae]|uniref:Lipoprotein n=1 Tax=Litorimonas cladophorae TaxID=1220491 RepID=A0A918KSY8_9PROT|nr:hypothetical protein [Litorimonas cladophorae]GGX75975.1 hypothetical protein GCM10011309_27540 [Litorimonas cladophorae]
MSISFRGLLLATATSFALVACGGGSTASPGSTGPVTVNPPGGGTTTPQADFDLVPNDNCPTGTTLETITNATGTVEACTITGTVTENLTLTAENGYALDGAVFVGEDGGANVALTIPAGVTVFGKAGEDYLVVSRGSRLNALGTASEPIVMTSIEDVQGTVNADTDRGLWGGLVINGFAPINDCIDATATGGTAGCEKSGEGSSGLFGGDSATDNSGTLQFMQVKYAGNLINDEDELNGIAFQGVGSGTTCDHIQVHNNADDGVEFFGGTVQCNYLVLTGIGDDSLDWTDGWQGGAQYVLVRQASDAGDRGIEGDNRSSNNELTPRSNPTVANFTFLGGASGDTGIVNRAGTDGRIVNGIITGFQDAGVDIDDGSIARAENGSLTYASLFLDNADNIESGDSDETFDTEAYVGSSPNVTQGNNSLSNEFFPGAAELGVTAEDLSDDMNFDNVTYIGAFGPTETPDSNWASGWTFGVTESPTDCPVGTISTGDVVGGKGICSLTGTLTTNVRLNSNFVYQLEGAVFVGEDVGGDATAPNADAATAILTIDAGTTIFGAAGEDYLVISRGSQIRSNGTASAPVNMTSRNEVFGTANLATDRALWGGLIINGRAPINDCIDATATGGTAECEKSGEGSSGLFGGNASDDNSGNLFYTRVSFAGNLINDEDELNGIAFQGVGNATQVDFIQVHNNADDGVEFFGGTVNVKHVVLTGNGDDSMDWTDGWTGNAQFVLIDQSDDAGDRGIEGDNRSSNNTLLPRSNPTVSNFTFVGGISGDTGMVIRAGTAGRFLNGLITGFQDAGVDIDSDETAAQATSGNVTFDSMLVLINAENLEMDDDAGDTATVTAFNAGANNLTVGTTSVGDGQYVPAATDTQTPATDPSTIDPFFDVADYVGAVRDANDTWYQGWTILVDQ